MAHFQDYRDFRFWSRDHGRDRMTSLFNFDIDNKGCVIKFCNAYKMITRAVL